MNLTRDEKDRQKLNFIDQVLNSEIYKEEYINKHSISFVELDLETTKQKVMLNKILKKTLRYIRDIIDLDIDLVIKFKKLWNSIEKEYLKISNQNRLRNHYINFLSNKTNEKLDEYCLKLINQDEVCKKTLMFEIFA